MKTFALSAAQGELAIRRLRDGRKSHPEHFTALAPEQGRLIIGHSETGHHHTMSSEHVSMAVMDDAPTGMRILHLIVTEVAVLKHERNHDTHQSIIFEPGEYEIRVQREYDPYTEYARLVAD